MGNTASVGRQAEERAVAWLRARGYRIIERNYRCRIGELDIVAVDGDCLVFIEVRSRAASDFGDALDAASPAKMRQVARVAQHYLSQKKPHVADVRIDVIALTGKKIEHIVDAYVVDG